MFHQRKTRNIFEAVGTTLMLIHHQTVYRLRTEHRHAVVGLLMTILQSCLFIAGFLLFYLIIGTRQSPIRADFLLFIGSGIFVFMTNTKTCMAVAGSTTISSALTRHDPLSPAILVAAAALQTLYQQVISMVVLLSLYHVLVAPLQIEYPIGCLAMLIMAWLYGGSVGFVLLGLRPWFPKASKILTTLYQRINMVASGKMFVANMIPNILLPYFIWNPLFHLTDQMRGFAFINYTPQKTDPMYALWVTMAVFMVGLLLNFTTSKYESVSWSAGQ